MSPDPTIFDQGEEVLADVRVLLASVIEGLGERRDLAAKVREQHAVLLGDVVVERLQQLGQLAAELLGAPAVPG